MFSHYHLVPIYPLPPTITTLLSMPMSPFSLFAQSLYPLTTPPLLAFTCSPFMSLSLKNLFLIAAPS